MMREEPYRNEVQRAPLSMRAENTKITKAALVSLVTFFRDRCNEKPVTFGVVPCNFADNPIINQPSRFLAQRLIIFTFLKIFAEN